MKWLSYIRYFFYIAVNWNLRIAFFIIRSEIKGERKYDIHTTGADELKKLPAQGISITHATIYMPVSYDILEELFRQVNLTSVQHFMDIGCGRGRALCVAASMGCTKLTGIDFSPVLCKDANQNLEGMHAKRSSFQYEVINGDARHASIPADADCFFFFNPFDEVIMKEVVHHMMTSCVGNKRPLTVIYVNPLHQEFFLKAGFRQVYHCKKMQYLEAVILVRNSSGR